MTCYFRHLGIVFEKAGIEVTKQNRKDLAHIIEGIVGEDRDCSMVWRQVKKRLTEDETGFVAELNSAWNSRNSTKV